MTPRWIFLPLLLLTLGCGSSLDDSWIARVGEHEVPVEGLERAVASRLDKQPEDDRAAVISEELQRLVTERLILNRALALGVEVSDAEVDARIQLVHGSDFAAPDPVYREEVRRQMTSERAALLDLAPRAEIPEHKLVEHFEEHREEYRKPARIQIRQIVVEDAVTAKDLRAEILTGADFSALARDHSLAPEAEAGGLLPPFAIGEMPEVFDRAFKLRVGELSEVIESDYGFHIFLLVGKFPPHEPEFGELREEILVDLQGRRLDELRRGWLLELKRNTEIEVNERLLETLQ
jgi:parvulin-like peptidyl-prolyl isomerase